ncbi:MAG: NAD(P)-binding protein, partial [Thiobacillaceae bacterium]
LYSHPLYERLAPWLGVFERRRPHRELAVERQAHGTPRPDVLVFGLGRYGERLARRLAEVGVSVLGVDFDPETVRRLRRQGLAIRFGDGQDPDFLESLPLDGVPWVVSTLPDLESNRMLLHALAERGYGGEVAVVARDEAQGSALKRAGVPTVLYPFRDAVDFTVEHLAALLRRAGDGIDAAVPAHGAVGGHPQAQSTTLPA